MRIKLIILVVMSCNLLGAGLNLQKVQKVHDIGYLIEGNILKSIEAIKSNKELPLTSKKRARLLGEELREKGLEVILGVKSGLYYMIGNFSLTSSVRMEIRKVIKDLSRLNLKFTENDQRVRGALSDLSEFMYRDGHLKDSTKVNILRRFTEINGLLNAFSKERKAMKLEFINFIIKDQVVQRAALAVKNSELEHGHLLKLLEESYKNELKTLGAHLAKEQGNSSLFPDYVGIGIFFMFFFTVLALFRILQKGREEILKFKSLKFSRGIEMEGFNRLEKIGVITVDEQGVVDGYNLAFEKLINFKCIMGYQWDSYLLRNFKREYGSNSTDNFYSYIKDLESGFVIESILDSISGRRVCTIQRVGIEQLRSKDEYKPLDESGSGVSSYL